MAGLASPGMAAAAWANPANKASRPRPYPPPWIGKAITSVSDIRAISASGMVIDPRSNPPGPSRHAGGHQQTGAQPACAASAGTPVARIVAGLGDGDFNQLLAVTGGLRPYDGSRQRVDVTVVTLTAVPRPEPGWLRREGHHRSAAVLASARLPGPLVALLACVT